MVELSQKVQGRGEPARSKRQEALARVAPSAPQRIRVEPGNDDMRAFLRHPTAGGFRSAGSADWPLDQFTMRRLKDGSVVEAADQRKEPRAK
jgi:hypothetical protein